MSHLAQGFGVKLKWLAVPDTDASLLAKALQVGPLTPGAWADAVANAYGNGWLFTPPIDGWTLVASTRLGPPIGQPAFVQWLGGLSGRIANPVYYFCTHRVVELHGWAAAAEGQVARVYAYLGERDEVLVDIGETAEEELDLRHLHDDGPDAWRPDEEAVFELAGAWTIDPRDLDGVETATLPWTVKPAG
ncbi:hypothetical protein [Allorhizocola rhizosphaerae]|uniref:hypothetical protein n=1 Tax=Allorhizocola rhizosphaerae TaxID=1872709 RepID=UPI000E3DA366|nr:hypothetical protein [Allorhizocola rhizosphaerae]